MLALLMRDGVNTKAELRRWSVSSDGFTQLGAIPDIGTETADYFEILVGLHERAIDRHLDGFLLMAGIGPVASAEAQAIINAASDLIGVTRAPVDHSVWAVHK